MTDPEKLARFVDADGQGWILEPAQRAAFIEDVFDTHSLKELERLVEEIHRYDRHRWTPYRRQRPRGRRARALSERQREPLAGKNCRGDARVSNVDSPA